MQRLLAAWAAVVAAMACRVLAVELHVSPRGNDAASGTSPAQAWRTLERVNRHVAEHGLQPGDAILLAGGSSFAGPLVVSHAGGGEPGRPSWIRTHGRGRARILAGQGNGILLRETPWVTVSGIDLVAGARNDGDGIRCDRDHSGERRIVGIRIVDCTAWGFGWHGFMVDAAQRPLGFEDVRLERCVAQGNRHAGIMVYGGNPSGRTHRPHARVEVLDCVAWGNPGDPGELRHHSGSGILLDGVDEGRVAGCVAAENGGECRNDRGGPVGIWTHASRRVVIERCESHHNRSLLRDGGGFDLDGGCEECVLRWNYSHDNHGPGLLVYTYTGAAFPDRDCRVEGNISVRDGAPGTGYGGLQLGAEAGCRITGLVVTRNTVIAPAGSVAALRIMGESIHATVSSNLVVASSHGVLAALSGHRHSVRLAGNHYWREDGSPVFLIDHQWSVRALSEWRHPDGVETRFHAADEVFGDPRLGGVPGRGRPHPPRRMTPHWPSIHHGLMGGVGAPQAGGRDGPAADAGITRGRRGVSRAGTPGNRGID